MAQCRRMLAASRTALGSRLANEANVLDVGGWAAPLARADWVIDLMPYETRGLYGERDPEPERFTGETWVVRDICDREPWPFDDGQFDFVVCAHTLEDVRDPVWVCSELQRVARAGYIEVPSRLEEQTWGVQGPWVGWGHHHWLIEIEGETVEFIFKPHLLGLEDNHFPAGFADTLSPEERVELLWWEDSFTARERIFLDASLDDWLREPVRRRGPAFRRRRRPWRSHVAEARRRGR